ncbi:lipopolysaccharide biosynthesis protein [Rhodococcoides fascians]|uniref:lipopolysaccharide biosynthesis protein n=1 Tax=Rhodococcoides fascians TaxID=1828 RepID=UPI00050CC9DE|nr:polysaccharide biosynthesis C-terminal domain-containing protein [Rhodococcus fascians]
MPRVVPNSNIVRAGLASFWSYSGRVFGLLWTAAMIHTLGVGEYGIYAMGFAGAALLNAPLDNAFFVRSLRVSEDDFQRERCLRVLFGTAIAAVGIAVYTQWYVAGFAIVVAAGELLFNTFKSSYLRESRPDVTMRFDAARQLVAIGLGGSYLYLAQDPQLYVSSTLYLLPYIVIWCVTLRFVPGRKPQLPGHRREITLLSSEAFAAAAYASGDVLIIGYVAGSDAAGYYSVAIVTALAIASIGQNYANTFVNSLRDARGHVDSAPPVNNIVKVSLTTAAAMAAVGVGVLLWGGYDDVGYVALILSLFVFGRSVNFVFTMILSLQHRDALRVRTTASVAALKVVSVFVLSHWLGGYGAAIACVYCEFGMLVVYRRAIYVHRPAEVKPS